MTKRPFTLIELPGVIAIIAILAAENGDDICMYKIEQPFQLFDPARTKRTGSFVFTAP